MNKTDFWFRIAVPVDGKNREAVSNFFFEQGCPGLVEEESRIIGYWPESCDIQALEARIRVYLEALREMKLFHGDPDIRRTKARDWGESWRDHFHAVEAAPGIVIKPPWEKVSGEPGMVVDIMPGMAFGTGTHESTRLSILLLKKTVKPEDRVLDMGTGSGILAIVCARLGASHVVAVDIDGDALENARENARLNHVEDRIDFRKGSLDRTGEEMFDVIAANIDRPTLLHLLPGMKPVSHSRTSFVLSGFLKRDRRFMTGIVQRSGLEVLLECTEGMWSAVYAVPEG